MDPLVKRTIRDDSEPHQRANEAVGILTDLVFLHGFSQNSLCTGPFVDMLAKHIRLQAVDLPGHRSHTSGSNHETPNVAKESARRDAEAGDVGAGDVEGGDAEAGDVEGGDVADHASLTTVRNHGDLNLGVTAALVGDTCGAATYIGYSMGGRVALNLALNQPNLVRSLILISTTAGISDDAERSERRSVDFERAAHIEEIGVERFVEEWLDQPLFAGLDESVQFVEQRRSNTAVGLATSLRDSGAGSMTPLWDRLHLIDCPTLILSGVDDERYSEIARALASAIGDNATHVQIAGSGHSVHLESPELTAVAINEFIAATEH